MNPHANLIVELTRLANETNPNWGGAPVPAPRGFAPADANERAAVQVQGQTHGCHTCLTKLDGDFDQPWIGDHIPPNGLSATVQDAWGLNTSPQRLLPSCDTCSSEQANLVRALNAEVAQGNLRDHRTLTSHQKKLLLGGNKDGHAIWATSDRVSATEGALIQAEGARRNCHACGGRVPRRVYIADHCPPTEWETNYMPLLCTRLGVAFPNPTVFRPHCPRCSTAQGGALRSVVDQAKAAARTFGIVVY